MSKPFDIIPSILTNDPEEALDKIRQSEQVVERVQIDIVDGIFAPNKTIDPTSFQDIETKLALDYHLMTKEPINWVERCIRGGADRIIAQIEMMENQLNFITKVQEVGISVGLALDINTDISKIDNVISNDLDVVLIMSVKAGFTGQKFDRSAVKKIKQLNSLRLKNNSTFRICIDGGITPELVPGLVKNGVDEIVIGKRLFMGELKNNLDYHREFKI